MYALDRKTQPRESQLEAAMPARHHEPTVFIRRRNRYSHSSMTIPAETTIWMPGWIPAPSGLAWL